MSCNNKIIGIVILDNKKECNFFSDQRPLGGEVLDYRLVNAKNILYYGYETD